MRRPHPGDVPGELTVRLLGPVLATTPAGPVDLGGPQQRTVFALLATDADRPVPAGTLIERTWPERRPADPRAVLYGYVSRLRRALGPAAALLREPGGYRLAVDPDRVDLHRARRLVERARPGPDRSALLGAALDLWHAVPLADLPGEWAARVRQAWQQEHLDLAVAWGEAELAAGRTAEVIARSRALLAEHPVAEPLTGLLMRALVLAGRSGAALTAFAEIRARLAEDLGVEPDAALRRLHQEILRGGPQHPPPPTRAAPPPAAPAQLPADVGAFVGRTAELAALDAALADPAGTAPVALISGTAGVGKSALAVRWAHRAAGRFPDGQLHVNLRGYDPGSPVEPAAALAGFLRALGVPEAEIPIDADERSARFRSALAGRRVLLVLDNAGTVDQVRPLLPGGTGSAAIVTSRDLLPGLVAVDGAHRLDLGLLPPAEATALVRLLVGRRAVAAPEAAAALATRCARLPLAVRVAAELAARQPAAELTDLVSELDAALLDVPDDDPYAAVGTVFSWSLRALPDSAATMFRLLGLHPGPDITAAAAASLAGRPVPAARAELARLTRANLVTATGPGRYGLHDLLRRYAVRLAGTVEPEEARRQASSRILDHYLHTAYTATLRLDPTRTPIAVAPPEPAVVPEPIDDLAAAAQWFDAELPVLHRLARWASDGGEHRRAWQLAWALDDVLDRRGEWLERIANARVGLTAARRLDDRAAQAHAHRLVALPLGKLGRYGEARDHLGAALALCEPADQARRAKVEMALAITYEREARPEPGLRHARRALELFQAAGDHNGTANVLNTIGWLHAQLGDHRWAVEACEQALALLEHLDDLPGQASTWDSLGYAHEHLGDVDSAVTCYTRAIDLYDGLGDRFETAESLRRLGDAHAAGGSPADARAAWRRALDILDELGHPHAELLRAALAAPSEGARRAE